MVVVRAEDITRGAPCATPEELDGHHPECTGNKKALGRATVL